MPHATAVLLEALQNPVEADHWFPDSLPRFDGWLRFTLLKSVLDRVDAFEDLAPAAMALIPLASDYTVDRDWGPLLVKAFPTGYTGTTEPPTSTGTCSRWNTSAGITAGT
jgi:hypothetical protein